MKKLICVALVLISLVSCTKNVPLVVSEGENLYVISVTEQSIGDSEFLIDYMAKLMDGNEFVYTQSNGMITSVNGVGPKAAMSILSAGPQNFTMAVMTGDEKLLTAAQGVGKKIAQRIILELKDKIGGSAVELDFSSPSVSAAPAAGNHTALATAALQELGYSPSEIATALKGADPNATTEEQIRHALRAMVMKG